MTHIDGKTLSVAAVSLTAALLFADSCLASKMQFEASEQTVNLGATAQVKVILDAEEDVLNAVEGAIAFPADKLRFIGASDGDSVVNFWIKKPAEAEVGKLTFSGIAPGGFSGKRAIFTALFAAKSAGKAEVSILSGRALKNDGSGNPSALELGSMQMDIVGSDAPHASSYAIDRDPPEPFMPKVFSSPKMEGGKRFLVFATQDKGSGMAGYSVCEEGYGCTEAQNPYLLKNQQVDSPITVKATDRSGNVRTVIVPPLAQPSPEWTYRSYALFAIIPVSALFAALFLWRKLKKCVSP